MSKIFIIILAISFCLMNCSTISDRKNSETVTHKAFLETDSSKPIPVIPNGWKVIPNPNPSERQCANHSSEERKVSLENGTIKISKYIDNDEEETYKLPPNLKKFVSEKGNIGNGLAGYLHIETFDNGWLIGSDAGEWGGMLNWFDVQGKRTTILEDNIRGIAKVGDEILVLSGLAHLGIDEGKIFKLVKTEKGELKTILLLDLKTQPQNFVVENNDSIIVSLKDKIIRVKLSGEIQKLIDLDLKYLYPNSMVLTGAGEFYLGMRMFVVRVKPTETGFSQEWLVPQDCQKIIEKNEFECGCEKGKLLQIIREVAILNFASYDKVRRSISTITARSHNFSRAAFRHSATRRDASPNFS